MLLNVTQSPQKEFDFSVLNSINEWTDSNKAWESRPPPLPNATWKEAFPSHQLAQLECSGNFPHEFQVGKQNMEKPSDWCHKFYHQRENNQCLIEMWG